MQQNYAEALNSINQAIVLTDNRDKISQFDLDCKEVAVFKALKVRILAQSGQEQEAKQLLKETLQSADKTIVSSYIEVLYQAGQACLELNMQKNAHQCFERLTKLPTDSYYRELAKQHLS